MSRGGEDGEEDDGADDGDDEAAGTGDKGDSGRPAPRRARPAARVASTAAARGVEIARRYPRASLASGLSAVILAGVMVLQPGKGKHDTTAAIRNPAAGRRPPRPIRRLPGSPTARHLGPAREPDGRSPDAAGPAPPNKGRRARTDEADKPAPDRSLPDTNRRRDSAAPAAGRRRRDPGRRAGELPRDMPRPASPRPGPRPRPPRTCPLPPFPMP